MGDIREETSTYDTILKSHSLGICMISACSCVSRYDKGEEWQLAGGLVGTPFCEIGKISACGRVVPKIDDQFECYFWYCWILCFWMYSSFCCTLIMSYFDCGGSNRKLGCRFIGKRRYKVHRRHRVISACEKEWQFAWRGFPFCERGQSYWLPISACDIYV